MGRTQRSSPTAYSYQQQTLASIIMQKPLPRLVAFDLDYTLWPLWVDTHVDAPLRRPSPNALNSLVDRFGTPLKFYPGVPSILHRLHESQVHIAAASRTATPDLARDALALLLVPPPKDRPKERPMRAIDFFESLEIYPGSKRTHFGELHKSTGIPYSEMLFFDDEERNREVESLGVTFVHVSHKSGMSEQLLEEGLKLWRKNRGLEAADLSDEEDDEIEEVEEEEEDGMVDVLRTTDSSEEDDMMMAIDGMDTKAKPKVMAASPVGNGAPNGRVVGKMGGAKAAAGGRHHHPPRTWSNCLDWRW